VTRADAQAARLIATNFISAANISKHRAEPERMSMTRGHARRHEASRSRNRGSLTA
jgi:hypothetical protein